MKLLAHVAETPHEEGEAQDVAEINAVFLIGAVAIAAIIGFIVWKFIFKK